MSPIQPKIFLSSTYVDLHGVRAEVIRWLTGVFGTPLIVMETSGSDTAPPNVRSIRRVRQCDIFIGIYCHRYGTIDPATGESITELELDEARTARSAGVISDLLLYTIDPASAWLSEFTDTANEVDAGRNRLRQKLQQHTHTVCRTRTELLFSIVRDVYRSIAQRFFSQRRTLRPFNSPSSRPLRRPVGMEFLTSGDADHLIGREELVQEAIVQLQAEPMVLLLGESGIGKTSLIHAGIIPKVAALGWRPVYARPLGMPCTDLVDQIESSAFQDGVRHGPILPTVAELLSALGDGHLLLIIDQFEDVLQSRSKENLEELLSGLSALRELSDPRLHILVSYRSDLEGRLGTLWQRISGSPKGLARVYVGGLSVRAFWAQLKLMTDELGIPVALNDSEVTDVRNDIVIASKNWAPSGLYPPYIQMLVDFIFSSRDSKEPFTFQSYRAAGAIFGIVRNYLSKQLRLAHGDTGELRSLLVALVKSYGVKAQRSLQELATDTGLEITRCEAQLERLIDLRLARHISGLYEVSHDFLAKIITEELVDSDEREFKRFRELLAARAVAFDATSSRLAIEEVLFLYKHKRRIIYTDHEARLIIETWIKESAPGLFWIKDFDPTLVERYLATYDSANLEPEQRFQVVRLKWLFGLPLNDHDYSAMTRVFRGSYDAARALARLGGRVPLGVGLLGMRSRQGAIRDACAELLTRRVEVGQWDIVDTIYRSQRKFYFRLFFEMACNRSIPTAPVGDGRRSTTEFRSLQLVERTPLDESAHSVLKSLRSMRPRVAAILFAGTVDAIRQGRIRRVLRTILVSGRKRGRSMIIATETATSDEEFEELLRVYVKLNEAEVSSEQTPSVSGKAEDLSRVIRRLANIQRTPALRRMLARISLKPSARDIAASLLTHGDVDDVTAVLLKISEFPGEVRYENHQELCLVTKQALIKSTREIPETYVYWVKTRDFWQYISARERGMTEAEALLPLRNQANRSLFVRLLAHAVIGLVRSSADDLLRSLVDHSFLTVSSAAAIRMCELGGDAALSSLSAETDAAVLAGRSRALANAIRRAEESLYIQL